MRSQGSLILVSAFLYCFGLLGCAGNSALPQTPPSHGKLSELSRVAGEINYCSHRVPESVCTQHHPELIAQFKRSHDWCAEHGLPESQCFQCHPDLSFEPLPELSKDADLKWLSKNGEDVEDLKPHLVAGKITIFDFYADWCAACRKIDGYIYARLANGDRRIAYRKLNVVDWDSPLAQRYLKTVPSLPWLVIYSPNGKQLNTMHGADVPGLEKILSEIQP